MRLLERLSQSTMKRQGFQRQTPARSETLKASVIRHLAQVLNHRLQPGAIANSEQYALWHDGLAELEKPENRETVKQYLETMDPRLSALTIRTLSANETFEAQKSLQQLSETGRMPEGVFAIEAEIETQFLSVAVMKMSNGQLQIAQLS